MFGVYENFPDMFHSVCRFSCMTPPKELQGILIQSLYGLNRSNKVIDFPEFTQHNIQVEMDLGVADGLTFNYLDEEVFRYYQKKFSEQVLPALDFLCIVRYYAIERERRSPLRFDYFMLRFLFNLGEVELRIYHEKGTRRLAIEDLMNHLVERINRELAKKKMGLLRRVYMRTL